MTSVKKALLVGCNYSSIPANTLYGCIGDIININDVLTQQYGYSKSNIIMLRDDNGDASRQPTYKNIMKNLTNLVNESASLS